MGSFPDQQSAALTRHLKNSKKSDNEVKKKAAGSGLSSGNQSTQFPGDRIRQQLFIAAVFFDFSMIIYFLVSVILLPAVPSYLLLHVPEYGSDT